MSAIRNADSFDRNHADVGVPMPASPVPAAAKGNPYFAATFNLTLRVRYFTLNGGTYTPVADPANINAGLQSDLPFFIFGNNDFASGFKKLRQEFPVNSNWNYARPGIWGKDDFSELAFDANVEAVLEQGDLVQPFTSPLPGTGTTTLALMIVRCPEVGYGTLLDELSSDRFEINMVRYVVSDTNLLNQFSRQIQFNNLSIFGKFENDKLTPNDFKSPEQFQLGIIDIPIAGKWGRIDKHKSWGLYNMYNLTESSWTVFCNAVDKLSM